MQRRIQILSCRIQYFLNAKYYALRHIFRMKANQIKIHLDALKRGCRFSVDSYGHLRKVSFLGRIWRVINPAFSNRQDVQVINLLMHNLEKGSESSDWLAFSNLYYKKILQKRIFPSRQLAVLRTNLIAEIKLQELSVILNFSKQDLKRDIGFVEFAYKSHFHHRIDAHFQKRNLGARFNPNKGEFELSLKDASQGVIWVSWKEFPAHRSGGLKGYDLLAHGFEQHSNASWKELKPCKILSQEEAKKFTKSPHVELVTTIPTFKNSPGFFGHIYINFYVPKGDKVEFYSLCYDLKVIRFPDPMEFFPHKRISTAMPITIDQWNMIKKFIEKVQETHIGKHQKSSYKHPEPEVENFYRQHMEKNCGNFACALFHKLTGKDVYALMPVMKVLFPKFLYKIEDWLEDMLPSFLKTIIRKINIVARGVMPWELITKQKAINKSEGFPQVL